MEKLLKKDWNFKETTLVVFAMKMVKKKELKVILSKYT